MKSLILLYLLSIVLESKSQRIVKILDDKFKAVPVTVEIVFSNGKKQNLGKTNKEGAIKLPSPHDEGDRVDIYPYDKVEFKVQRPFCNDIKDTFIMTRIKYFDNLYQAANDAGQRRDYWTAALLMKEIAYRQSFTDTLEYIRAEFAAYRFTACALSNCDEELQVRNIGDSIIVSDKFRMLLLEFQKDKKLIKQNGKLTYEMLLSMTPNRIGEFIYGDNKPRSF